MGQKKVILDTNIYISALGFAGNEREVLEKCLKGDLSLYLSEDILKEIERVLEYPKFDFSLNQKDSLKLTLAKIGKVIPINNKIDLIKEDPSDNIFLEAAIASEADFIITGNKHLLKLKQFGKTVILKAADFLRLI